jgi:hypothetical protein
MRVMSDGTIVELKGPAVSVIDRASGQRGVICRLNNVPVNGARIRAEDVHGRRIFIAMAGIDANSEHW